MLYLIIKGRSLIKVKARPAYLYFPLIIRR